MENKVISGDDQEIDHENSMVDEQCSANNGFSQFMDKNLKKWHYSQSRGLCGKVKSIWGGGLWQPHVNVPCRLASRAIGARLPRGLDASVYRQGI